MIMHIIMLHVHVAGGYRTKTHKVASYIFFGVVFYASTANQVW